MESKKVEKKRRSFLRVLGKVVAYVLASVVLLIILVLLLIQTSWVQNFARKKIVSYLTEKLHTKVAIGQLSVRFPTTVSLKEVYCEDQSKDTLLYGGTIRVNLSMFGLLKNDLQIKEIYLDHIVAKVKRLSPDSLFNFQFIMDAFGGNPKETSIQKDTAALKLDIKKILVRHTRILYQDALTGNDMDLSLTELDTRITTFDPAHMLFDLPSIHLTGLKGYFYQLEPLQKPVENTVAESAAAPDHYLQLLNKEIQLKDIQVVFKSDPSHLNAEFKLGTVTLHPQTVDLKNSLVQLKDASLLNSSIRIETNTATPDILPVDTVLQVAPTPSFKILANALTIEHSNLNYDDQGTPHAPSGMDFSHLGVQGLSLQASAVLYSSDRITASLQSAQLKEKSGFVLNKLTTDFSMTPSGVSLNNLLILTPGSQISKSAKLSWSSLEMLKKDPGSLGLDINLVKSHISLSDLLTFLPQLKEQLTAFPAASTLQVNARIKGRVNNLDIQQLTLSGLGHTRVSVKGLLKGLPNPSKLFADLDMEQFQTTSKDLLSFLPQNALPPNIQLPQQLSVSGQFKGGMQKLQTALTLRSSLGNVKVAGYLAAIDQPQQATYDLVVHTQQLQLGKLLTSPELGALSGDFSAKGRGYEPQTADAILKADISSIHLRGYTYHNLKAQGQLSRKAYNLQAAIHDPNLEMTVEASGIFSQTYPSVQLRATIDSIKTLPLGLTTEPLLYHSQITGDFTSTNPDTLNGNLAITHSILVQGSKRITLDSISIIAKDSAGSQFLSLQSDLLNASIKGKYQLTQLATVFQQAIDPYFSITSLGHHVEVPPYHFALDASLNDHPVLHEFFPDLQRLKPILLSANFASDSGWRAAFNAPQLIYGTTTLDSLRFEAGTRDSVLAFNTSVQRLQSGSSFSLYATSLDGTLQHNQLSFLLSIKDAASKDKYRLGGSLDQPATGQYQFRLNPDSLLLNYDSWVAQEGNQIDYQDKELRAKDFIISRNRQQLSLNSTGPDKNAPLKIDFKDFKLETLTAFVQSDSLMINGLLNGTATVENLVAQPTFTADLTLQDLSVYKDTLGTLTAKVNNKIADQYHADIQLEGYGNQVTINGDYLVKPDQSSFDLTADITSLQMKVLEGFTHGGIKNASGNLYGHITLKGTTSQPDLNGKIQFNNTAFNVSSLNNVFKIDKEAIAIIDNKGIEVNKFSIRDAAGNAIVIDGAVNTTDFTNYTFDLKINARNFQAINSTSRDNKLFYGKMVFSSKLTVKGTPTHPVIDGDLVINDKTQFTVVLPQEEPGVAKREGIVRFVDRSSTAEDSLFMAPYDSLKTSMLVGYDVSINININKEAIFNLIVDQANGDFLRLKGTGQLTGGIDASGKITLVGSYEIEEGSYDLSFNFIKRKFNIQKGSRIVWTGEPTTAQIDVTALYISNTAPIDLVQNQIVETNQNIYKQKLPFEVHLKLQGELLKPEITFDIVLPEDKNYNVSKDIISTVETKLSQLRQETGEMNKQVFALLLLNRFVGEDPFSSSGGTTSATTFAMQSVSRLLSEQLNQLAQNLVQGVDINFDLATTQDYTTGSEQNRTDLNVGLSKSLLSDRLTVTVGSSFELSGPAQTNQQNNNLAGDISVNYKLSKDGKYLLRAYRKNDNTGTIEGYVIETGLGFIISVDYNKFKQIFLSKAQRRKNRQIKEKNRSQKKADQELKDSQQHIPSPENAPEHE